MAEVKVTPELTRRYKSVCNFCQEKYFALNPDADKFQCECLNRGVYCDDISMVESARQDERKKRLSDPMAKLLDYFEQGNYQRLWHHIESKYDGFTKEELMNVIIGYDYLLSPIIFDFDESKSVYPFLAGLVSRTVFNEPKDEYIQQNAGIIRDILRNKRV